MTREAARARDRIPLPVLEAIHVRERRLQRLADLRHELRKGR